MHRRQFLISASLLPAALAVDPEMLTRPDPYALLKVSPVHFSHDVVLPQSGLPATFYTYREEYRANDVWRLACYYNDEQYGLECDITDRERDNSDCPGAELDKHTQHVLIELLDENMVKTQRDPGWHKRSVPRGHIRESRG